MKLTPSHDLRKKTDELERHAAVAPRSLDLMLPFLMEADGLMVSKAVN